MIKKPLISIVIANYDGKQYLNSCLRSIFKEKEGNFEVIIVDDHSADGSDKVAKKLFHQSNFHLYYTPLNNGPAKARNIGAAKSHGHYLFFLDFDTRLHPGWSKEITTFFSAHKHAGATQAKLLVMGTKKFDYAGDFLGPLGFLIERAQGSKDTGKFDFPTKIFSVKGAGMIFRKSVFDAIHGFDEEIEFLWEEPDITWRVWLVGYEVYFLPGVVVEHAYAIKPKNEDYYRARQFYYRGARNNIMSLIKNMGSFRLFYTLPVHIGCWIVLSCLFMLKGDVKNGFDIIKGILWNIIYLNKSLKKRYSIQRKRKMSDRQLFKVVSAQKNFGYYLRKTKAYISNKPF